VAIYCCKGCVAPKRYPGCHAVCPEYIAEKAKHDEEQAAIRKKKETQDGLNSMVFVGVEKARKARRKMKGI
jgi:hypothetical protein